MYLQRDTSLLYELRKQWMILQSVAMPFVMFGKLWNVRSIECYLSVWYSVKGHRRDFLLISPHPRLSHQHGKSNAELSAL